MTQRSLPSTAAAAASLMALALALTAFALTALASPATAASPTTGGLPAAQPAMQLVRTQAGAAEDERLKFGLGPARAVPADQYVDGRAYLTYVANPGATLRDEVVLLNYSPRPLTLQVYATDAMQGAGGAFGLLPGDAEPSDAGSWIKLDVPKDREVTIPGRRGQRYGTLNIPFLASIPADAAPGDHVGGVIASLQVTSKNKEGVKITLDQRIGLRTYFQLTGEAVPGLKVENLTATFDDQNDPLGRGVFTVSYDVHNTGQLRLDATQELSVDRFMIRPLTAQPAPLSDILPGSRIRVTQVFPNAFGLGPATARVTLHPTPVDEDYAQAIPDATAELGFWAWPWVLLAIVAGLLLLIISTWLFRRWRKRRARNALLARAGRSRARLPAPVSLHRCPASSPVYLAPSNLRNVMSALAVRHLSCPPGPCALPAALVLASPRRRAPGSEAEPPKDSLAEVILETGDATANPYAAILDGWWGHEAGTGPDGRGATFISMNGADVSGVVTPESVAALHDALGDGGSFDSMRVAFVPYSADGSNERPEVVEGDTAGEAFRWFADLGMGAALSGSANPNDFVATVSTASEYNKWWDAGRPLQGYTGSLGVVDIAGDGATRPAPTPQGTVDPRTVGLPARRSAWSSTSLTEWTRTRPQVPTVAAGPDGRALTAWLTFRTVADPGDPSRSSAGYQVLTGAGTGARRRARGGAAGSSSPGPAPVAAIRAVSPAARAVPRGPPPAARTAVTPPDPPVATETDGSDATQNGAPGGRGRRVR